MEDQQWEMVDTATRQSLQSDRSIEQEQISHSESIAQRIFSEWIGRAIDSFVHSSTVLSIETKNQVNDSPCRSTIPDVFFSSCFSNVSYRCLAMSPDDLQDCRRTEARARRSLVINTFCSTTRDRSLAVWRWRRSSDSSSNEFLCDQSSIRSTENTDWSRMFSTRSRRGRIFYPFDFQSLPVQLNLSFVR